MENQLNPGLEPTTNNLSELVSLIAGSALPAAVRKKSFIVNDIPCELHIASNETTLTAVLSNLLNTLVSHTENSCIRISAKAYGDKILLFMKDTGSFNNYAVSCRLQQLQSLANKVGGCISITHKREELPAIAFSFPYMGNAA